jgi:hypothetical protein
MHDGRSRGAGSGDGASRDRNGRTVPEAEEVEEESRKASLIQGSLIQGSSFTFSQFSPSTSNAMNELRAAILAIRYITRTFLFYIFGLII